MNSKTILVIDDDTIQLRYYERLLRRHKYEVTVTTSATGAIDLIDTNPPDAVLLDMLLGGHSGMALLHELASHDDLAEIPIIMITNLAPSLSLADLAHYGVVTLLDKTSMQPSEIITAIKRATEQPT